MDQNSLRTVLLQNDRPLDVESQLTLLNDLVRTERQRADRLRFWTIAVWAMFFALVAILVMALPFSIARAPMPLEGQSAIQTSPGGGLDTGIFLFLASILLLALVGLPSAGTVLLIFLVLARRSATLAQFRSSITVIEAQLKSLAADRLPSHKTGAG